MSAEEWLTGTNSQSMLLALRDSPCAGPDRLRLFLERFWEFLDVRHRDETVFCFLRENPDAWSAAAGLARYVVAIGSSDRGLEPLLQPRIPDRIEFALCRVLRECFDNPLVGQSPDAVSVASRVSEIIPVTHSRKSDPGPPFHITIEDGLVVVDAFSPSIHRHDAGLERELPVLRDVVRRLVEVGHTRFVLDLRTANADFAYPIAKWGALSGAWTGLRCRMPDVAPLVLAKNIKLVGAGELLEEIQMYRIDGIFECFDTVEQAKAALREQSS